MLAGLSPMALAVRGGAAAVAAAVGNELVQNGDFASSTGWTLNAPGGGSVTISGGTLNFNIADAVPTATTTALETVESATYRTVFTVVSLSSGNVRAVIGGALGLVRNSLGTFSEDIVSSATDQLLILRGGGGENDLVVDDFSVKRIG